MLTFLIFFPDYLYHVYFSVSQAILYHVYFSVSQAILYHVYFSVSQAILYHMSELKGMSRNYEKFGVLGLDEKTLQEAVMTTGSFVLKTSELQQ